jgi:hypothetical protein
MTTDEIIASLDGQHDRYRGSGTLMEKVLKEAAVALKRLRLTDEERAAVGRAAAVADEFHDYRLSATLRSLLERTRPDA